MKCCKPTFMLFLIACLVAGATAVRMGYSDETSKSDAEKSTAAGEAAKETPADAKKNPRTQRLPNYFGQVGLSDEQKENIYAVQAKYRPQIEELQASIRELRKTERIEILGLLTETQKAKLNQLIENAKRARKDRRRESSPQSTNRQSQEQE